MMVMLVMMMMMMMMMMNLILIMRTPAGLRRFVRNAGVTGLERSLST